VQAPHIPSDRVAKWQASVGVPDNCRLTLVGDTNSLDVFDVVAVIQENVRSLVDALFHGVDDLPRVVFVPSVLVSMSSCYYWYFLLTLTEDTSG